MDFRRTSLTLAVLASVALVCGAAASWAAAPATRAARPARVNRPGRVQITDAERRIDVNNINMFVTNVGSWAYDFATGNPALIFPKGTANTAVYESGIWLGATVNGQVRVEVSEYSQEFGPGSILASGEWDIPSRSEYVVYKVARGTGTRTVITTDLAPLVSGTSVGDTVCLDTCHVERSAAERASDPSLDPIAHHSWSEYVRGAVPYGALVRWWHLNSEAPDDSVLGPDVLGDQMLWSVYNDADPANHTNSAGASTPLGIEIRQTTFAFSRQGALGNTVFLKFEIIRPRIEDPPPGTAYGDTLRDMYVSLWSDPDLGGSQDDLVGCDTTLSLGFCYNATNNDELYGARPPAVGYDFFLGPKPYAGAPTTLGMTSFNKYINGTDPASPEESYSYMLGLQADGSDLVNPVTGLPTRYFNSGDPVIGTGWLDNNAADKRMMLSSGPFIMAPGDTQVIVGAIIIGQCGDRLSGISTLKFFDTFAQDAFDKDFDLPSPPASPIVVTTVDHGTVTLTWDAAPRLNYGEDGFAFEGYNVYQGETVAGPWRRLATYDEINQVRIVYDEVFDLTNCFLLPQYPTAVGTDLGVRFTHTITQDAVRGGSLRDATEYYFAVTAFSYGPDQRPKILESPQVAVRAIPQRAALGTDRATASATEVEYVRTDPGQTPSTEEVTVQVVRPEDVTGHTYRVDFTPLVPPFQGKVGLDTATVVYGWSLTDTTTGEVKLAGQVNQRGDEDYRVVDGLVVKVTGSYFPNLQNVRYSNVVEDHYRALTGVSWSGNVDNWFYGGAGDALLFWGNSTYLDPAAQPDSFTTVGLVFTEPRMGQKAYRYLRLELGDSTSVGDTGDPAPQGTAYIYGGFHRVNFWAIDAVNGDTLDVAWVERMRTDSTGTLMPDAQQLPTTDSLWTPDPGDGSDTWREYLFVEKSIYSETDTMPKALYDSGNDVPGALRQGILPGLYTLWAAYRAAGDPADPMQDRIIDPGDEIVFTWAVPATRNDVYYFSTSALVRGDAALAKSGLERIRVVPNPYYNRSGYELSQFSRVVRFINLPEEATVRIYSLSGQLVRTLRKTDPTVSVLSWDLQTENRLPVASGVYVYHVEAKGVGSITGRLVVFMEKERLNTF